MKIQSTSLSKSVVVAAASAATTLAVLMNSSPDTNEPFYLPDGTAFQSAGGGGFQPSDGDGILQVVDNSGNLWSRDVKGGIYYFDLWDAVSNNPLINSRPVIQNAIDAVYMLGGGIINFSPVSYYCDGTPIYVWQHVVLQGAFAGFRNQFLNNEAAPTGTAFVKQSGVGGDILRVKLNVTWNGTRLIQTGKGTPLVDYRHHGGCKDIIFWGSRSNSFLPNAADINSTGRGAVVQGARYVIMENVFSMFCAEDGTVAESFDYGAGAVSCNNLFFAGSALSNGGNGFDIAGGDCSFGAMNAGYNGLTGITASLGSSVLAAAISWNNFGGGFYFGGKSTLLSALRAYDNSAWGFKFDNCDGLNAVGCEALTNGRSDNGNAVPSNASDTAGFHVTRNAKRLKLKSCDAISNDDFGQYGLWVDNSIHDVVVTDFTSSGHLTQEVWIADKSKLKTGYDFFAPEIVTRGLSSTPQNIFSALGEGRSWTVWATRTSGDNDVDAAKWTVFGDAQSPVIELMAQGVSGVDRGLALTADGTTIQATATSAATFKFTITED